jgi:hypothetical protein
LLRAGVSINRVHLKVGDGHAFVPAAFPGWQDAGVTTSCA